MNGSKFTIFALCLVLFLACSDVGVIDPYTRAGAPTAPETPSSSGEPGSSSSSSAGASSSSSEASSSSTGSSSSSAGSSSSNSGSSVCGTASYEPTTHFCDIRDDKIYKWVDIKGQIWMAENLNYQLSGGYCGDESSSNRFGYTSANTEICDIYGRLYSWPEAMNNSEASSDNPSRVRGVCPYGWHLPSDAEWETLGKSVDPNWISETENFAGAKLKTKDGWTAHSLGNSTDEFEFSARPGGYITNTGSWSGESFSRAGDYGAWWTTNQSVYHENYANCWFMEYNSKNLSYTIHCQKGEKHSVRCVKDGE